MHLWEYLLPRHLKLLSRLEATIGDVEAGKVPLASTCPALDSRVAHETGSQQVLTKHGIPCVLGPLGFIILLIEFLDQVER